MDKITQRKVYTKTHVMGVEWFQSPGKKGVTFSNH